MESVADLLLGFNKGYPAVSPVFEYCTVGYHTIGKSMYYCIGLHATHSSRNVVKVHPVLFEETGK
jgi:hypothetical protein